jgi:hypothetical protein
MAKRKKRASGEGHIRQRADKRWEWIYTVKLWNGRTVQKNLIKRRQADLMRERRRILAKLEKTGGYARTDLTVGEYLRLWLSDSVEGSVKDTTYYDGHEHIVRHHLDPSQGRARRGARPRPRPPHRPQDRGARRRLLARTVRHVLQTLGTDLGQAVILGTKKPRGTKPEMPPIAR